MVQSAALATTAPLTNGTLVLAGGAIGRWVFGTVTLTSTLTNPASLLVEVETGPGSNSYVQVQKPLVGNLAAANHGLSFCFFVPTGRRFRFTKGGLAGVTETVQSYSFMEM